MIFYRIQFVAQLHFFFGGGGDSQVTGFSIKNRLRLFAWGLQRKSDTFSNFAKLPDISILWNCWDIKSASKYITWIILCSKTGVRKKFKNRKTVKGLEKTVKAFRNSEIGIRTSSKKLDEVNFLNLLYKQIWIEIGDVTDDDSDVLDKFQKCSKLTEIPLLVFGPSNSFGQVSKVFKIDWNPLAGVRTQ